MAISKVTSAIVVLTILQAISCTFTAIHVNEALYSGFKVIQNINKQLKTSIENEFGQEESTTVKAVCPLLDRQRELKQFISSGLGKAANMTEIEATLIILDHVLNDTCNWIKSLPNLSNFVCSDQDYSGLESFCIKQEIADTVPISFTRYIFDIYGNNHSGVQPFHAEYHLKWINESEFSSDETLSALQHFNDYKTNCDKTEEQKIVCSELF
ncbi:PREDICTED: uncharacterized protein LOC109583128 [Amphimedon queenslandica]|uniref:Uncharacterized protein n=1 Tax=Amphimedon queenslandica TaxID=400682 RepID=A0A1X7UJ09_AMPQE|nr:PREDICTED: uncharacterized protein LOC109583128 [Amphimedon queenslandica]|eukprot:XP_019853884.1 PREDICTED: uncharacterized protein LOC109583128 [Amphimedon queenslandica]